MASRCADRARLGRNRLGRGVAALVELCDRGRGFAAGRRRRSRRAPPLYVGKPAAVSTVLPDARVRSRAPHAARGIAEGYLAGTGRWRLSAQRATTHVRYEWT